MKRAIAFLEALERLQLVIKTSGGTSSTSVQISGGSALLEGIVYQNELDPETVIWRDRAISDGGSFTSQSIEIANNLILAIKATAFNEKIKYLMPLLGGNLATALVPLRDALNAGAAGNLNFTNDEFSEQTGLQGSATTILDSNLYIGQLNPNQPGAGGLGAWVCALPSSGFPGVMGCGHNPGPGSTVYTLYSYPSLLALEWGRGAGAFVSVTSHGSGNIYGQSYTNVDREIYKNGQPVISSTAFGAVDDYMAVRIRMMGTDISNITTPALRPWSGRAGAFYLTDGTLTQGEIQQFNAILNRYLMAPTGRPRG